MHTFTQKKNQFQQRASSNGTRPGKVIFPASYAVRPVPHSVSVTAATSRASHDFSRMPVRAVGAAQVQTKLKVNTPGDSHEQEADRVANQVMRMSDVGLQRAPCACGGDCSKCQSKQSGKEQKRLQTKRVRANDATEAWAPPIVHEVLDSPGQPMDSSTRAFFEPRFGYDFGHVRVHTDAKAAQSAQSIGARAYTVGRHIVFGETFEPRMPSGKSLLAHELVHVVQQGAQEATGGALTHGSAQASPQVQRQADDQEKQGGATPASTGKCYTCDLTGRGEIGVCCYAADAPLIPECFELGKRIIDECQEGRDECLRKAQCAACQCIGAKAGAKYCQCTGIV